MENVSVAFKILKDGKKPFSAAYVNAILTLSLETTPA